MTIGVPWMFWSGATGGALGALLAVWALAGDWARMRGRSRRCSGCWYSMEGVPGLSCPECGRTATSEHRLRRSRRRWGWLALAVALAPIEAAAVLNARLAAVNWPRYTPSWLLVRLVKNPAPPSSPTWTALGAIAAPTIDPYEKEMWDRYAAGTLSIGQRRVVASREFNASHPPLTLESRARWPAGAPVAVVLHPGFSGPLPRELRATVDLPGAEPIVAYEPGWIRVDWGWSTGSSAERWRQVLGTPGRGALCVALSVTVREGGQLLWRGTVQVPIKIQGDADEIVEPDTSEALAGAIRHALASSLTISPDGRSLTFERPLAAELHDATLGLRIEFIKGGAAIASAQATAAPQREDTSTPWHEQLNAGPVFASIQGDPAALLAAIAEPRGLVARVTGDPQLALQDFTSTKYWSGRLDLPWSEIHVSR